MLQKIRSSSRSGWTYLLVGMLIVIFAVFFGIPGDACGSGVTRALVASVDGKDIYNDDVNIVYNRVYGNDRRVEDEQRRQQQAQALRAVLLIHLLADKARDHGLRVDDDELVSYIKDPLRNAEYRAVYGRDGGFDGPLYKAYVQNQLRLSIQRYEDWKRTELLAIKYITLAEMQFQAAPWEVTELHELRGSKVNLEFVKFAPEKLVEFVPVTDEDVDEFVAAHDADIRKYYDENRSDYEQPEEVLIRRLFIVKPEQSEGEEVVKAAIEKWDAAKTRIEEGESFADVAGEFSDSERETQGLMEWTTLENVDQNIANEIREIGVGETAEVETDYAFMLVKLEDRKEAKKTPLEEVKSEIGRTLLQQQKVEDLIQEMIAELQEVAGEKESLQEAVAALRSSETDETGEASETGEETADEEATDRWAGVTVDTTGEFSQEGQDLGAMFGGQIPGMSTRTPWDRVPKIGKNPDLARDAFSKLTPENPTVDTPYQSGGNYFYVRLAERIEPSEEDFEEEYAKLVGEVRGKKAQQLLGPAAALFSFPVPDYGPLIEGMLDRAIDEGVVKLYERNYAAVPLLKKPDKKKAGDQPIDLTQPPSG